MSKLSKAVKQKIEENSLRRDETVVNFMGGDSYEINPVETMKMVTASSIFGEPSYYRDSASSKKGIYEIHKTLDGYTILNDSYKGKTTDEIMTELIDNSLDYDFKSTLEWALYLRKEYNMRLNPQVIMVRAAIHPKRQEFTENNPGMFDEINQQVMGRADEAMSQMAYYLYINDGKKNNIPSIIKRSWAKNLSKQRRYNVAKYKNHEIGMINAVRLCHANSAVINELMKNGTVEIQEDQKTWENLKSAGKTWREILDTVELGHMALLRNLRNIFEEIEDAKLCSNILERLKKGVLSGKQFPFRYYSAMGAIKESKTCHHKPQIIDALEECMDIAIANFPKLEGKTMCLSDNSGSAWGGFTSEYGTNTVAKIDNLSSVMTAMCSDEGYVGKFGDRLIVHPISKRAGILQTAEGISKTKDHDCGGRTEGGIWEFFNNAINNNEHWDNIFIYSDQQAGHGGLYGTAEQSKEYKSQYGIGGYSWEGDYINVFKLIQDYRKKVNPKVNVFSIQTAGYNNVVIPEMAYRTAIMYGWTGKEAIFAKEYISQWNELEKQKEE